MHILGIQLFYVNICKHVFYVKMEIFMGNDIIFRQLKKSKKVQNFFFKIFKCSSLELQDFQKKNFFQLFLYFFNLCLIF